MSSVRIQQRVACMLVLLMASLGYAEERATLAASAAEAVGKQPMLTSPVGLAEQSAVPLSRREDNPIPTRGLVGKRVATDASTGRIWYSNTWRWEREDWFAGQHAHSAQEDLNTARIVNRWLLPYLENAGAVVFHNRCRDEQVHECIIDPSTSTLPLDIDTVGDWQLVDSTGARAGKCFTAKTVEGTTPTAVFSLRAAIPASGFYGVTIWYPSVSNASTDVQYVIIDGAGNRHRFRVDQSTRNSEWVWLDRLYFEAGDHVLVAEVTNASSMPGRAVAFDALRLGGGMGTEDFGGGVSGVPRWQECAVNWTKYTGAPSSVWNAGNYGEDYTTRFYYAQYCSADIMARVLNNGASSHTGYGSEVYQYSRDQAEQSRIGVVYQKIIQSIRGWYAPGWRDRGVKANSLAPYPYAHVMLELAFSDNARDASALMDAKFRRAAMRGYYEGIVDFLTSSTGVYSPEPPEAIAVRNTGNGMARVSWRPSAMGGVPTEYRVYTSTHPQCFCEYTTAPASASWVDVPLLQAGHVTFVQMRALNEGGISFPSETLAAAVPSSGSGAMPILIVNGYDRFDWDIDETDNRRDYVAHHARAIVQAAASLGLSVAVDSCANEAVAEGATNLTGYRFVDWLLGQESTADDSLTTAEQGAIAAFRDAEGGLLVSGTDVAFDLGNSSFQAEKDFLSQTLLTRYVSKTTETLGVHGVAAGPFDGVDLSIDDGTGDAYRVLILGVVAPQQSSEVCLTYGLNGLPAAICSPARGCPLYCLAFPFEAISGEATRQLVMERMLSTTLLPASAAPGWELYE